MALGSTMMQAVPNAAEALVIDLTSLGYLDSAVVNMLADIDQRLELAGTAGLLPMEETVEDALGRISERSP